MAIIQGVATFTVYGYHDIRGDRKPLHQEGFKTQADAAVWLMDDVLANGTLNLNAVIVRLDNGEDINGQRHVVKRFGDGRAWWE